MNDICCIGHITLDKIVTPKQTAYMPGGTSYYFSHGISHLKDTKHYKLVTALAPTEFKAVEDIRAKGIEVKVIPSRHTVYFENIYLIYFKYFSTSDCGERIFTPVPSPASQP